MLRWLKSLFYKERVTSLCKPECKFCAEMEDKYYPWPLEMVCQPSCKYCNPGVSNDNETKNRGKKVQVPRLWF